MATDEPAVTVENLSFRYRARPDQAIQDVSFTLWPGEILLLAGASGGGKTTVMGCINGLIPRSYKGDLQGRVLRDEPLANLDPLSAPGYWSWTSPPRGRTIATIWVSWIASCRCPTSRPSCSSPMISTWPSATRRVVLMGGGRIVADGST